MSQLTAADVWTLNEGIKDPQILMKASRRSIEQLSQLGLVKIAGLGLELTARGAEVRALIGN